MTTIVIPAFFSLIERLGAQANFPVLGQMLSKASVEAQPEQTIYQLISSLLGAPKLGASENTSIGVSAVMQLAEISADSKEWTCCASPVVVMPNRDHLDLAQVKGFDISLEEAQSFCDEFNDYFKEDGFRFSFDSVDRWYCHADEGFEVSHASPFYAEGQNIAENIPQGKDGAMWRKMFNDMQLLLHHSATNQKRVTLGKTEFNSLWLWGGGNLIPSFNTTTDMQVSTNDLFAKGVALRGKLKVGGLSDASFEEESLIISDLEAIDWLEWDKKIFTPALAALKQGKTKEIRLYLDEKRIFVLKKTDLYYFWKKEKPVLAFIERGIERHHGSAM